MQLSQKSLKRHIEKMLETLDANGIVSFEEAMNANGKSLKVDLKVPTYVKVHVSREHEDNSTSVRISYERPKSTPIEFLINPQQNARCLTFICSEHVPRYSMPAKDRSGNTIYSRRSYGAAWSSAIYDVRELHDTLNHHQGSK